MGQEEDGLEPLGKFDIEPPEEKQVPVEQEQEEPEEEEEHTELEEITEMEKNLNHIWDTAYNCYLFRVRSGDKDVGQGESILDFKRHIRRGEYVQACEIMEDFLDKYLLARQEDMNNRLLMKATFNTIKAKVENL